MKYLVTILLLASLYIQCGTTKTEAPEMIKETSEFNKLWVKIDSLENEGLLASALKETTVLLNKAQVENQKNHIIKALFYKAKFNISLQEDSAEFTINEFESELSKETSQSYLRIYQSILGQLYSQYAQQNQYKIRNRTSDNSVDEENIAEMSLAQLIDKSNTYFTESIEDIKQEDLDLANYDILIDRKKMKHEEIDLYSLLLIRALNHFKNDMHLLTEPVYASNLYTDKAFGDLDTFIAHSFVDQGSKKSFQSQSLLLYQKLLKYHLDDPIIDKLNVDRLRYIYQIHNSADKTELYRSSLLSLAQVSSHAKLALAELDYDAYGKTAQTKSKNVKAHMFLQDIIEQGTDQDVVNKAKNLLQTIIQPLLNLGVEKVILPNEPSLFTIDFKNLEAISLVVKKSSDEINLKLAQLRNQEQQLDYIQSLETHSSWSQNLPDTKFTNVSSELILPPLPIGQYIILVESDRLSSFGQITVSNLSYAANNSTSGINYIIADRKTGKPLQGVKAELYERNYRRGQQTKSIVATKVSDKAGRIHHRYAGNKAINIRLESNGDVLDLTQGMNPMYTRAQTTRHTIHTFTDRNIYRPGQKVYVKAIVLQSEENNTNPSSPVANDKLTLTAYDVNRQEVHKIELKTNQYGSVSTDFNLPKSGLGGQYRIEIQSDSGARKYTSIRVEDYKRPTFFSELSIPNIAFQIGDSITITGTSSMFSGPPVDGATVEYRVTRNQIRFHDWYRYISRRGQRGESAEIKYGSTRTNSKGEFEIDFVLKEGTVDQFNPNSVYIFSIEITTTDSTGETHTSSETLRVSRKDVFVSADITETINLEKKDSIKIFSKNINNINVPFSGRLTIHSLKSPNSYKKSKYWNELDTAILTDVDYEQLPDDYKFNESNPKYWDIANEVFSTDFTSTGVFSLKMPTDMKSGFFKLRVHNTTNDNIEYETITRVLNFSSSTFDPTSIFEYKLDKDSYTVGDNAQLTVGSAQEDVQIFYQLEKGSEIIDDRWIRLNTNTQQIPIPVMEADRGGFMIHLLAFYKNRMQQEHIVVNVPHIDKKLKLTIESFKSTLEPGSEEEWTINIVDHNDNPVAAELVASMYDASLDALSYPNVWQTFNYSNYRSMINHVLPGYQLQYFRHLKYWQAQYYNVLDPNSYFPDFNFFGYMLTGNHFAKGGRIMKSRSSAPAPMSMDSAMETTESTVSAQSTADSVESIDESIDDSSQDIDWSSVRDVLDETVFFSPHLISTQAGHSTIKFKMSDALSSWKLQVFVHDINARYGYELFEIKTQKDLSIYPNVPRFLRVGDKLSISAKIVNSTDSNIKTSATIQFINPDTNEDVTDQVIDQEATIHQYVNAHASSPVTWPVTVDETMLTGLIYRMKVGHEFGSDAIEGFIPVTTDRILITESLPFYVAGNQTKHYTFENLNRVHSSPSADLDRYTVEYTANPSWYVYQALPYLATPEVRSSSQILNQYVSHRLAKSIIGSMPQLKSMLQNWERKLESNQDSPLKRNAELKMTTLESTPWLRQSMSEEEQRSRLLDFYQENQSNAVLENTLKELLKFQNPDGGFSWLPGRPSSQFISSTILENIGRLAKQNISHDIPEQVIALTIDYIDAAIDDIIKSTKKGRSYYSNPIQLLFARSYFADSYVVPDGFNDLLQKSVDTWQQNPLHKQAQLALVSHRINQHDVASKILESLQEQMISTEDKGAYWKLNRDHYSNHSSIDKQVLMIELFHELQVEQSTIDQLRIWLLRNKQTNHWKTNQSTASAVYAFLMNHNNGQSNWISDTKMADIRIGNAVVKNNPETAALYIKEDIDIDQINSKSSQIEIQNPNEQSGWGAAYIQYYDDIASIDGISLSELSIQKELFKQVMTDDGLKLESLSNTKLTPGDKIVVKLVLQTDRSLEYVQIRDERGSGLEPADVLSGFRHQDGLHYYQETKDASSNFYISQIPRGTHVLEYTLKANLVGTYTTGIATVQCMYAPEFTSHSNSVNIEVSPQ